MMTPCEKLGYKVGDRFEVVGGSGTNCPWNEKGLIIELSNDNGTDIPYFRFPCGNLWVKELSHITPLNHQTEAEKRGAKFGTMGVVKATGEWVVFQKEASGIWYLLTKGSRMTLTYDPSEIRLDHEPEYKEIPFSEATEEQRIDVGNLVYEDGECKVVEIHKFSNGSYAFTIENNGAIIRGVHRLTVRVPV